MPQGCSYALVTIINSLLKNNPLERLGRGGAEEIKSHPFFKRINWPKLARKEVKPPFAPHVVCETNSYLNEIVLFNQMSAESQENTCKVGTEID